MSLSIDKEVFVNVFDSFLKIRQNEKAYLKINNDRSIAVTQIKEESSRVQEVMSYVNQYVETALQIDSFAKEEFGVICNSVKRMESSFNEKQSRFWIWIRNLFIWPKIQAVRALFQDFSRLEDTYKEPVKLDLVDRSEQNVSSLSSNSSTLDMDSLDTFSDSSEQSIGLRSNSSVDDDDMDYSGVTFTSLDEGVNNARMKKFIGPFHVDSTSNLDPNDDSTIESLTTSSIIRPQDILSLSAYPNLKSISFIGIPLDLEHFRALATINQLHEIAFIAIDGCSESSIDLLSNLPQLTHLTFYSCIDFDSNCLKGISKIASLKELFIQNCFGLFKPSFDGFDKLKGLTHLVLSYVDLPKEAIGNLNAIASLQHFSLLIRSDVEDKDFENISQLVHLTELDLDATDSQIFGANDQNLQFLQPSARLERLSLRHNRDLTDKSATKIASIASLQVLDIHGTSISDEGIENLKSLQNLKELIVGSSFGSTGSRITSKIFKTIEQLNSLERLNLFYTDIYSDEIREFRQNHPSIKIIEGLKNIL